MNDWRKREVRNEMEARDRNEWIEDSRQTNGDAVATEEYVCECGSTGCVARILLSRPEYEDVRRHPTRFAVAVDHENPEVDQLVSEGPRYSVVQKMAGAPARIARQTYHRNRRIGWS